MSENENEYKSAETLRIEAQERRAARLRAASLGESADGACDVGAPDGAENSGGEANTGGAANADGSDNSGTPGKNKATRPPLRERIENFWYHYKWHSIIALFLVFTVTVCAVQLNTRKSYDTYIMYVGNHYVSITSSEGDEAEYVRTSRSLQSVVSDLNGDGESNVSLLSLLLYTNDELKAIEDYNAREDTDAEDKILINYSLQSSNLSAFNENMLHSNYYLCFMSEELFLMNQQTSDGLPILQPISQYVPAGADVEYASEYGVYLRSLDIYALDGIRQLPEDTVVCIRVFGAMASAFGKRTNQQIYANSEEALRRILAYSAG